MATAFLRPSSKEAILDRCVFKNRNEDVYLVADAYQGSDIKSAVTTSSPRPPA